MIEGSKEQFVRSMFWLKASRKHWKQFVHHNEHAQHHLLRLPKSWLAPTGSFVVFYFCRPLNDARRLAAAEEKVV